MSPENVAEELPLRVKVPIGEFLESFLKESDLWEGFQKSKIKRRYDNEILALKAFVRERNLEEEFKEFRNAKIVGIRLSGTDSA